MRLGESVSRTKDKKAKQKWIKDAYGVLWSEWEQHTRFAFSDTDETWKICKKQRICYAIQKQLCPLKLHARINNILFSKAYVNKKLL